MSRTKLHELSVVARAGLRAQRRRRTQPPGPGRDELERLRSRLDAAGAGETRLVDVPADRPPWTAAGIELEAGETVTTFAVGRAYLSRVFDVWGSPPLALWFRVGAEGPAFRGTRAVNTFTAPGAGPLELGSYLPGGWADPAGTPVASPREYRRMSGGMSVLVVRWSPDADSGALLGELAAADESGLAAAELDRRAGESPEPAGWRHLWVTGRSETFRDDGPRIACHSHGDAAIVRREVDAPLTGATRLRWSWRVDQLPSGLAEDTLLTHDYLSIGLEFDNGQDLTWHWSAELPPGYGYRCPIPAWKERETHVVVRSGTEGMGRWISEETAVRSDYAAHVGEPPERIVGIWLLAVTTFQRGTGRCAFEGIELS